MRLVFASRPSSGDKNCEGSDLVPEESVSSSTPFFVSCYIEKMTETMAGAGLELVLLVLLAFTEVFHASHHVPVRRLVLGLFVGHATADLVSGVVHRLVDAVDPWAWHGGMRTLVQTRPWTRSLVVLSLAVASGLRYRGYALLPYMLMITSLWLAYVPLRPLLQRARLHPGSVDKHFCLLAGYMEPVVRLY